MLDLDDTVLLPIDIQSGFDAPYWGARNNPSMEANGLRLIDAWRRAGRPILHVRHDSLNPASPLHPASLRTSACRRVRRWRRTSATAASSSVTRARHSP